MHNNETPTLIPSRDVCKRLGIDRSTLTRWVAAGKVEPAMKLDGPRGAYLFDARTVAALAAS